VTDAVRILREVQFQGDWINYMFCYQCEQTFRGQGCVEIGTCGKDATTATLQDLLVHAIKGVSMYAHRARQAGAADPEIDAFVVEALFATLTNVNFDPERLASLISRAVAVRDQARALYVRACNGKGISPQQLAGPADWTPAASIEDLLVQGKQTLISEQVLAAGQEITSLQELVTYGIKGVVAYAQHAKHLGGADPAAYATIHEVLDFLTWPSPSVDELLTMALRVGELNYRVMELLDRVNTDALGHPEPTRVRVHPRRGKAIVVSGHDLADLHALLKQTEGLGIQIYTHGEMLPAHGYPKLKAFKHLAGNYGGAWQDQANEFAAFPGPIVMTSNCIQEPKGYNDRIFTTGPTAWPGVQHVANHDFAPVIAAALSAPGFTQDGPDDEILVGFGHQAVLSVADKVIDAVKAGAIRHFFLVGGCDGARPGRNYFTEFAQSVPKDCLILTLACGKFRFNKLDFGEIGGLPRLLDIGQCNDAYSALQIAGALAKAFGCGVNDLPLSLVLSWYEQKAVAILLTLLHFGIRNIRLGPTLPAFITPAVLGVLQEKFNIMAITTPQEDLAAILN
jgi:hydroxylamine reductase